ncbi:MAG: diaminopimelate epimerase, partial [Clostridia bacterium]|nr:diaminopimelate epimerase [Clostridia bacterium]
PFPERINTEFVRIINKTTMRLRVWERGNGETLACGTGACAAVAAAVKLGFCAPGKAIDVKLPGGTLSVIYTGNSMILSGEAVMVFEGEFVY